MTRRIALACLTPVTDGEEHGALALPSYGIRRIQAAVVGDMQRPNHVVRLFDRRLPDVAGYVADILAFAPDILGLLHLRLVHRMHGGRRAGGEAPPPALPDRVRRPVRPRRRVRPAVLPRPQHLSRRGGGGRRRGDLPRHRPPARPHARGAGRRRRPDAACRPAPGWHRTPRSAGRSRATCCRPRSSSD